MAISAVSTCRATLVATATPRLRCRLNSTVKIEQREYISEIYTYTKMWQLFHMRYLKIMSLLP